MSLPSARRLVVGAVAGLATAVVGLVAAPAALASPASLPVPAMKTTLAQGESFTLTLSGCFSNQPGTTPAGAWYQTNDPEGWNLGNGAMMMPDGSYTFTDSVFRETEPGTYQVLAVCDHYHDSQAYPPVTVTIVPFGTDTSGAAWSTASTPTAPPSGAAVTSENGVTAVVAAPGQSLTPDRPFVPGQALQLTFSGYTPGEVTSWTLHSTPRALGSHTADTNGTLSAALTLPTDIEAGSHELWVTRADGTVVTYPVRIAAGPSLAYTGADVTAPLALGGALLVAGAGTLVVTRRRRAGATHA